MRPNDLPLSGPQAQTVTPANPDYRVVTVWSDIASPVAALALHTLHQRSLRRGIQLLVDHRAYPTELLSRQPTPKDIVDGELAAIAAMHPELGWQRWPMADASYPVTTLLSMEAVQAAKRPEFGGLLASDELDAAIRCAFLVEGRCISLYPVIVEIARRCPRVNGPALLDALAAGTGRSNVMAQWVTAAGSGVAGSPHLFTQGGFDEYSPGVVVAWPAEPGVGIPSVRDDDAGWADRLLDTLRA